MNFKTDCKNYFEAFLLTWTLDQQVVPEGLATVCLLKLITAIWCFVFFFCSSVVPLKMAVKLGDYNYHNDLKDLARRRMEDSEYLSPTAKPKLASVK